MNIEEYISTLVKVSTFARKAELSTKYAYDLIKEGKIKSIEIDGVKFISLKDLPENIKNRLKK